jgi:hypothetical protein
MKRRIQAEWYGFEKAVLPATAGENQRIETRKAFFAGASAIFALLVKGVSPGTGEPTDGDMALMDDLAAEIRDFGEQLWVEAKRARGEP